MRFFFSFFYADNVQTQSEQDRQRILSGRPSYVVATRELNTDQDFLCELDMKPHMHLSKINIFSLYHIRTMEDYQHPPESLQNSDFQIHFSVTKNLRIFILAIV